MPTRQLATIMFVGLVDSSHLMQEDEDLAMIQLEKLKKNLDDLTKLFLPSYLSCEISKLKCIILDYSERI